MTRISDEQIAAARSVDLLSYLQAYEPGSIKKSGPNEHCLREHDSLKISNGKWFWFSRGIGSNNALDFLVQVRGMKFTDAVQTLASGRVIPISHPPVEAEKSRPLLALPVPNANNHQAIAYLMRRGISKDIIDLCIEKHILYESRERHNCVFVGRNAEDKVRFACQRGIDGNWKKDVTGSDKRFGFCLPSCAPSSRFVAVCESPVDALSLATLRKMETNAWDRYHYLSLSGTAPMALMQYLKDHPEVDHVYLYLDNDRAGLDAMARIKSAIYTDDALDKQVFTITVEPPPIERGKDWNEVLQSVLQEKKEQTKISRPDKEAAI